jgi:para-nitrobenzyl esterase
MKRNRYLVRTCGWLLVGLLAGCGGSNAPSTTGDDLAGGAAAATAQHAAFAITDKGVVRGIDDGTVRKFLGIPFAAAPVGDLRFKPPEPHARWLMPRDATAFGAHCPQVASPFGIASTTEDCLFLNVWAPSRRHHGDDGDGDDDRDGDDDHDKMADDDDHGDDQGEHGLRPVMVWIHGGALRVGESDDYDATKLVNRGNAIVVTINYRLGALGFMAHPALTAESPDHASGNYGFLDQQAALRWVRRNIVFFGGNPFNVTVFGESAGGLSTHVQLASPLAAGLFQRAIVESGAYMLNQPSLATAEGIGTAIANRAGCTDQTAACLRALSVAQILANQGASAAPNVDNHVLTQSIGAAFTSGQFNRVPIMEGANHDEWRLFVALNMELVTGPVTAAGYIAAIQATLGVNATVAGAIAAQYPLANYPSPSLAVAALGTDAIFDCNARHVERLVSQFVPTFAYEFSDPNAPQLFLPPVSFPYAAAHASEIQYLFALRKTVPAPDLNADQQKLSNAMVSFWTTFARTGQPNSMATPMFPAFQAGNERTESLIPPTPQVETNFASFHKCAFWVPADGM